MPIKVAKTHTLDDAALKTLLSERRIEAKQTQRSSQNIWYTLYFWKDTRLSRAVSYSILDGECAIDNYNSAAQSALDGNGNAIAIGAYVETTVFARRIWGIKLGRNHTTCTDSITLAWWWGTAQEHEESQADL